MPGFFQFDPLYFAMVLPTMALAMWASWRVQSRFRHYAQFGVRSGMTGAEAAMAVARAGGAHDVRVERSQGFLSDHYNPLTKTLALSPDVHDGRSISSIAVAAHEAGHAIQHATGYAWLNFRSAMVPVVKIGSNLWIWVFLAGTLMLSMSQSPIGAHLQNLAILLFGVVVLFQLVTLPVEFDASRRAKLVLASSGIVSSQEEAKGVSNVLGAAAMTYVAGALTSLMTLLYYIIRAQGGRREES